jgi:NAD(P)-dependent dehydrogenase (short-subunit alcohol dehydrogenase family)
MSRILITGASRGIGRAIAKSLAEPGRKLLLHGRDKSKLEQTAELVRTKGAQAEIIVGDIATADGVADLIKAAFSSPIDLLVNNAGIAIVDELQDVGREDIERTMAINLTAPFLLTKEGMKSMKRGAMVINISSIAAKTGFSGWSSYCASKFALEGFTQSVRPELAERGIRIVSIYPSSTDTDIWNDVDGDFDRSKMLNSKEVGEVVAYIFSRPDEVLIDEIKIGGASGVQ